MVKSVLITRTDYDDLNHYLFEWTEEVVNTARKRGLDVQDIQKQRANKSTVVGSIKSKNPVFIFFNGHGTPEIITGHNDESLIVLGENENLLKSRIVYARSCFSASGIGMKCAENNPDGCFIGYSKKYFLPTEEHSYSNPLEDDFAKPFLESSNIIPISIIKGNTVKEALEKSENIYKKHIKFYEAQDIPGYSNVVVFLKWDLSVQTHCGNSDVSI